MQRRARRHDLARGAPQLAGARVCPGPGSRWSPARWSRGRRVWPQRAARSGSWAVRSGCRSWQPTCRRGRSCSHRRTGSGRRGWGGRRPRRRRRWHWPWCCPAASACRRGWSGSGNCAGSGVDGEREPAARGDLHPARSGLVRRTAERAAAPLAGPRIAMPCPCCR